MRTLALVAVALTACSSGPSADEACDKLASAICMKIDACYKSGTSILFTDQATCVTREKAACVTQLGASDIGSSAEDAMTCATAVPNSSCEDALGDRISACMTKPGKRALGAACTYADQCESAACAIARGTNCGVCAAPSSNGDSCATASCSPGFSCVGGADTCAQPGASGAVCDASHPCGYRLDCVLTGAGMTGTCQPTATTLGAACDIRKMGAPGCDASSALVCGIVSKQCEAATYTGPGGACGLSGGKVVLCNAASSCYGAMGVMAGTCKALALEGQACDTDVGPSCMTPARCVTGSATTTAGTCQLVDPAKCG